MGFFPFPGVLLQLALRYFRRPRGAIKNSDPVELDTASLRHVFSFLSANDLVLSVKPLSRTCRQYVISKLGSRATNHCFSRRAFVGATEPGGDQPDLQAEEAANVHSCRRRPFADLAVGPRAGMSLGLQHYRGNSRRGPPCSPAVAQAGGMPLG
jgi:hypothetical protein